jgi:GDP-L-fucose synthase
VNLKGKRILITGGCGFLGTHICQGLAKKEIQELKNLESSENGFYKFRSKEFDLVNQKQCSELINKFKPNVIIHAAAKVGGIGANKEYPADYFYDNLMMGANIIHCSKNANIEKLVLIGTICSYPKFASVPFNEKELWNGYPEETNAPYGIAKKALLTQAMAYKQQYGLNFIYLMPVNLYGIGDNFDEKTSHVIPALIKKFLFAKKNNKECVEIWGTGEPTREFLYAEDAAHAIISCTEKYNDSDPMNIGYGNEIKINQLATMIKNIIGYKGSVVYNNNYPDGQPRRCLNISKSTKIIGFYANTDLYHGLKKTIDWYSNS